METFISGYIITIFLEGLTIKPWIVLTIFLLIATASALDLSGAGGKDVLNGLGKSGDLWTWGHIPLAHTIENNSTVDSFWALNPGENGGVMLTPSETLGLNEAVANGEITSDVAKSIEDGGWDSMNYYDTKWFGKSTKSIFDCTCFKTQSTAQFAEPTEAKAW